MVTARIITPEGTVKTCSCGGWLWRHSGRSKIVKHEGKPADWRYYVNVCVKCGHTERQTIGYYGAASWQIAKFEEREGKAAAREEIRRVFPEAVGWREL